MRLLAVMGSLLALSVALSGVAGAAAEDKPAADGKPSAVDLVFESDHLKDLELGKKIIYNFERAPSDQKLLGEGFTDTITLSSEKVNDNGGFDVDMQIYTGERARDLQKLPGRLKNPVFLVYFSQAVNSFRMLAGGQAPYLKHTFSNAFNTKAKVEPTKVEYDGQKVDAYRISMTPYKDDPSEVKMQGWEGAEYTIVVSDKVPGGVVDLVARYTNKYQDGLQLVERITLDGAEGLEETKAK
jgi:hypothetical protein